MSIHDIDSEEEAPLDPKVARIHIRLRWLLIGSSFIMFLGFAAVFAALYYRITQASENKVSIQDISQNQFVSNITYWDGFPVELGELIDVSLDKEFLVASFRKELNSYIIFVIKRSDGSVVEQYELTKTKP